MHAQGVLVHKNQFFLSFRSTNLILDTRLYLHPTAAELYHKLSTTEVGAIEKKDVPFFLTEET